MPIGHVTVALFKYSLTHKVQTTQNMFLVALLYEGHVAHYRYLANLKLSGRNGYFSSDRHLSRNIFLFVLVPPSPTFLL